MIAELGVQVTNTLPSPLGTQGPIRRENDPSLHQAIY